MVLRALLAALLAGCLSAQTIGTYLSGSGAEPIMGPFRSSFQASTAAGRMIALEDIGFIADCAGLA